MTVGPNPAISAEAVRRAFGAPEADAAHQHDVAADQAILDGAELREIEHADYYPAPLPTPHLPPSAAKRSLLDRLLGRGSR